MLAVHPGAAMESFETVGSDLLGLSLQRLSKEPTQDLARSSMQGEGVEEVEEWKEIFC
jgi:hypothetical protein